MIKKLLEAFFRHKWLLVLPPILIPGIATPIAVASTPPVYDAAVNVWVERPRFLGPQDGANQWLTPSQIESNRLVELLRTRAFSAEIAKRTSLAALVGSSAGETRIEDVLTRGVSIGRAGDHVLIIGVQAPTAQIAYELCTAIVDAYQEKTATDQADQSAVAVSFYQSQAQDADQRVAKASQDLRRYLSVLAASSDPTAATDPALPDNTRITTLDPKLNALQGSLQDAQTAANAARSAVAGAQREASASVQGQQLGFQVLDPARMPTTATRPIKKIIVYPIAAAVVGLGLTAILLALLVAGDRSVRSETDVTPGLRVLGAIPSLTLKRVPKQLGAVATRRAMGSPAGMALPAPARAR